MDFYRDGIILLLYTALFIVIRIYIPKLIHKLFRKIESATSKLHERKQDTL